MTKPMNKAAASRVQSATAKTNGGAVPRGSFAARAQSAAAKKTPPNGPSKSRSPSGKGRGNNPPKRA
ncbi:MAG TPA: hypothetical protein DEB61_02685 [Alcanivorax sp.]|nr:hypothetical protein [Alcanivorax sp.]HAI35558.1 hypothetical protein [Alcanivorax sp.]HAI88539.1 hypothetical protein [Alcanivorax sp.]HBP69535.1 hypothetical protein [Alcanivorax sp.]HBP91721.1 hypothetical protein [Alcanivorax sp.]